jgi:hypothetical protein
VGHKARNVVRSAWPPVEASADEIQFVARRVRPPLRLPEIAAA